MKDFTDEHMEALSLLQRIADLEKNGYAPGAAGVKAVEWASTFMEDYRCTGCGAAWGEFCEPDCGTKP